MKPHVTNSFLRRHLGPGGPETDECRQLLEAVGATSIEDLIDRAVPEHIHAKSLPNLPVPVGESEALAELREIARANTPHHSLIGLGYHGTIVPPVIRRNLLESPGWYTSYTPYQAEISQGRLEMLFHFQTLVSDLTGLPVANASLLDEATACAEAAIVSVRHKRGKRSGIAILGDLHPQCLDVLQTRCQGQAFVLSHGLPDESHAAVIVPWPDTHGRYPEVAKLVERARTVGALVIAVADPLALTLLAPPASWGADIVVGSMQRFGVPMSYGGPHAAYIGASQPLARLLPGRIVGQSIDAEGRTAYRLALQTREQHIRREKATSNICTAQALLANMAAAYAIWHGPEGLQGIARHVHRLAAGLAQAAIDAGKAPNGVEIFDTVVLDLAGGSKIAANRLRAEGYEPRVVDDDRLSITFDETHDESDLATIAQALELAPPQDAASMLPNPKRDTDLLPQPIFHAHRSETSMMRYLVSLASRDLALDRTMIPLGSCTMKLNAAAEMEPISWPEFGDLHPFAPADQAQAYARIVRDLEKWLGSITGFDAVSLQPNAGSQGELAGLLAIQGHHRSRGDTERTICLIPESAHGTNPASAILAGLDVIGVKVLPNGDIDLEDLQAKASRHEGKVAACMVTYPSTHGVFEEGIQELCEIIHQAGGNVYLDGANLNAMAGIARPGDLGADVCHMNLHKTFCIPHGGGGPGVGPIGVKAHLAPHLPGHWAQGSKGAVAGAPFGSAGILPIVWMYLRMMGAEGLRLASGIAILNANYVGKRLESAFPVAHKGKGGWVAHECIIDPRGYRERTGITAEDIAKRLVDYGFHAPTMEWPIAGTLMIEPTESENKRELDRFCDAMLSIAEEIERVASGEWPQDDNPLVNAPHSLASVLSADWERPYSRELAVCAAHVDPSAKYFAPIARVDNAYGDRNLVCCAPRILLDEDGE